MKDEVSAKEAIRSLYELYSNDIYRYAWMTLGDSNSAYDVVQEVFLRSFRHWDTYRQQSNPKTWLMSIARNYIFDLFRKKRNEREYLSEQKYLSSQQEDFRTDLELSIKESLSLLHENYRHVITLRYIENFSVKETAQILGWSQAKVKTRTHRGILKLREALGEKSREVNL